MSDRKTSTRQKSFVKVEFRVPAGLADEAAGILAARGALGCATQWPHKARRSGSSPVTLQAFFDRLSNAQFKAHRAALDAAGMLYASAPQTPPVGLTDPGWAAMWQQRFKPLPVGRKLVIVPPWQHSVDCADRIPIVIEPGQGFGTGHHATTRSTLIALETECSRNHFEVALDVGTGSGVLALAMVRLGVRRVVALDNDPSALQNARHNAGLNAISTIRFSTARLRALRRRFPLIAANILSSTLIAMAPELKRLLAPGGRLILSGILQREAADVMAHYPPPVRRLRSCSERGWTTLILAGPS
jgi:ribosomal protein L11 methyltransferase